MIESTISATDDESSDFATSLDSGSQMARSQIMIKQPDANVGAVHLSGSSALTGSVILEAKAFALETGAKIQASNLSFTPVDGSLIKIDLGQNTNINGLVAHFNVQKDAQGDSVFNLSTPANEALQMSSPFVCTGGMPSTLSSNFSLTDVNSLASTCLKGGNHP
jgi:hypothetical protein